MIEAEGALELCEANWNKLSTLDLCKSKNMQVVIQLKQLELNPSLKNGNNQNILTLVINWNYKDQNDIGA